MTLAELRAALEAARARLTELAAVEGDLVDERATEWETLEAREAELVDQIETHNETRAERVRESRARWQSTQVGTKQETGPLDARGIAGLPSREIRGRVDAILGDDEIADHLTSDQKADLRQKTRVRSIAADGSGDVISDGARIARLLIATSAEAYRSAFAQISHSSMPILSPEEGRAVLAARAMSIGSDPAGGFAVPVVIDPTIILTSQGSENPILGRARIETITNDEWKGVSSAGVTWGFRAEAATSPDVSPTIGQPIVTTRRADGTIKYSIEAGMDWPGFAQEMATLLGEGYSELLVQKLTLGTQGSNEPNGLISKLDATVASERELAVAATITANDFYGLWKALPRRFRNKATWMSSTGVQNAVRQLGTTFANFSVDITAADMPRIMGRDYEQNDYMSDVVTGTGLQPLAVVGDFKGYLVAQRAGMTVEPIPLIFDVTTNMPTGERGWFAWARIGADVIVPNAFRLLVNRSV